MLKHPQFPLLHPTAVDSTHDSHNSSLLYLGTNPLPFSYPPDQHSCLPSFLPSFHHPELRPRPSSPSLNANLPPPELCAVLSKHLEYLPGGSEMPDETSTSFSCSQEGVLPQGASAMDDDVLLAKMRPGQSIDLEAHCIKGAKKQPMAPPYGTRGHWQGSERC